VLKKLKVGDTIGIIAPSFFIEKKEEFVNGINILEKLGFRIKYGNTVFKRYFNTTAPAIDRAYEINKMFGDKEVNAIIASDGGCRAIEVLDKLDYELIKSNHKIFSGFSDITHLHLALLAKSGLKTIHGLDVINGFGAKNNLYTNIEHFLNLVSSENIHMSLPKLTKWHVAKDGKGEGVLIGGWLDSIHSLVGTPYFPEEENIILFWEAIDLEMNKINIILNSLKLHGVFEKVRGMIVGKLTNCIEKEYFDCIPEFAQILLDVTKDYNFPIIYDVDFGHGEQNLSLPIGVKSTLDTKNLQLNIYERSDYEK
jgi:muramoyltetrapeptide carboxypeptidase